MSPEALSSRACHPRYLLPPGGRWEAFPSPSDNVIIACFSIFCQWFYTYIMRSIDTWSLVLCFVSECEHIHKFGDRLRSDSSSGQVMLTISECEHIHNLSPLMVESSYSKGGAEDGVGGGELRYPPARRARNGIFQKPWVPYPKKIHKDPVTFSGTDTVRG